MNMNFLEILKHQDEESYVFFIKQLTEKKEYILHTVNDILVMKSIEVLDLPKEYMIINKVTSKFQLFDSEEEALNKVLDFYKSSKTKEQTNIFN